MNYPSFSALLKCCGISAAVFCICSTGAFAQTDDVAEGQVYSYPQKVTPQSFENYLFSTYYHNGKKTYNLHNLVLGAASGEVVSMKINPSGTSFATLSKKGEQSRVTIYDLWKAKKKLHEFKKIKGASGICYTPDGQKLLVAATDTLLFFDASSYERLYGMKMPFAATKMVVSPNGHYLAATDGKALMVWSLEDNTLRKDFMNEVEVNDFIFSQNSASLAVLTDDLLSLYSTSNFLIEQNVEAMGEAKDCSFHPDGKYLSVVTGDNRIAVLNLMDAQDRTYVDNELGGISVANFVRDGKKRVFLTYNTKEGVVYHLMDALLPNYNQLLSDELDDKMGEWVKMLPGETMDEYNLRVNEETRIQQMQIFEQEIATRMADNMLEMSEISFGNYSMEDQILAVNFDNMPPIYLDVPMAEANDFMDAGNLEFRNVQYGLNKSDKFEMVYADVYNKATGKTYVFDNRERRPLDFLDVEENFIPLEYVQQANMEESNLQEIKEKVVADAMEENIISDHTRISVDADLVPAQDENGNKITNYQVKFSYEVETGFSVQEDFAPGKYKIEQSGAAKAMLSIVKNALETEFAQYVKEGKKLQVQITGMADALPINGKIAYDGSYGDFVDEPVYMNDEQSSITVTKAGGVTTNEQLAFLRASSVKAYITDNVEAIGKMDTDYRYNIELTEGKGGEFRRITAEFVFVDVFDN